MAVTADRLVLQAPFPISSRQIRLPVSRGFFLRAFFMPGEWMSDVQLQRLRGELEWVTHNGLDKRPDYGIFLDERGPYENRIITLIYDKKKSIPVAFSAMPVVAIRPSGVPEKVVHLGLIVIDRRYRRKGLQFALYFPTLVTQLIRNRFRPFWVTNVSQTPAIVGSVADCFVDAYPHYDLPRRPPESHLAVAREMLRLHRREFGTGPDARFDPERFVIQNSFGGGSQNLMSRFEENAPYRNPKCNRFCRENLDYDRGDEFLQVALVTPGLMWSHIAKQLLMPFSLLRGPKRKGKPR